jgi:hypothetical protein
MERQRDEPWHVEARLRGPVHALTGGDPHRQLALCGPIWSRRSGHLATGGTLEWLPLLTRPVSLHQLRPNLARLDPESVAWHLSPAVRSLLGGEGWAELIAAGLPDFLQQAEQLSAASSLGLTEGLAVALPHELPRLHELLGRAGVERRCGAAAWGLFASAAA